MPASRPHTPSCRTHARTLSNRMIAFRQIFIPHHGQGFDDQCLGFIASYLRPAAFIAGEAIFQCGDRGDEMYLVVDGTVLLHTGLPIAGPIADLDQQDEQLYGSRGEDDGSGGEKRIRATHRDGRIVGKGDVFGESGLFTKELGLFRRESAEAMSWLSVYVLSAPALQKISDEYPEVKIVFQSNDEHVEHYISARNTLKSSRTAFPGNRK